MIFTTNNVQLGSFNFTLLLADNNDPATIKSTTLIRLLILDVPMVQVAKSPPVFTGTNFFSILNNNANTNGGTYTSSTSVSASTSYTSSTGGGMGSIGSISGTTTSASYVSGTYTSGTTSGTTSTITSTSGSTSATGSSSSTSMTTTSSKSSHLRIPIGHQLSLSLPKIQASSPTVVSISHP